MATLGTAKPSGNGIAVCGENETETVFCGAEDLLKCTFSDIAIAESEWPAMMGPPFEPCKPWCKDCLYAMGIAEKCPKFSMKSCYFPMKPWAAADPLANSPPGYCLTDKIPGKPGPQCVKSCEEFKLTVAYKACSQ